MNIRCDEIAAAVLHSYKIKKFFGCRWEAELAERAKRAIADMIATPKSQPVSSRDR
jgi:hypothetical protein